jgi:hypothetical protein
MFELSHTNAGGITISADTDANNAPVAREGIRPCKPLKPNARSKKYVGALLEQPIPLTLRMRSGGMSSS